MCLRNSWNLLSRIDNCLRQLVTLYACAVDVRDAEWENSFSLARLPVMFEKQ